MSGRSRQFPQILLECIDEGLSVLGTEPREAVYQFLKTICSLPRDEIPDHVPEFASGLKKALGGASKVIERVILRKLFEKTGSSFREVPDTDFHEYVIDARRRFEIISQRHDDEDLARSKKGQISG
jgi:hypothetical protein